MRKAPLIYDRAMHEARKYWRDRLESISFDEHIALDHPRPTDGQQRLSSFEQRIEEKANTLLERVAARNPFLSYTILTLALKICCYKYSGGNKVTIFSPPTSERGAGNLLPISSTLDRDSSFKSALLATKDLLSSAYRYQQYPLSRMLLDMPEDRRPKHVSMIASMVGFHEGIPDSNCDIVIHFETTAKDTKARFCFDSLLYEESTILHFFKSFSAILQQGLSEMTIRIEDLMPDYASVADGPDGVRCSASSPTASNVTKIEELEGACLHRLIEAQVTKTPESVAIVEGDRVVTYKMLNYHADQLAETLVEPTLDLQKPIVILLDASIEMVVSMLAVMKIGVPFAPVRLLSIRCSITEILKALDCECIICKQEHLVDLQQFRDCLTGIRHVITLEYLAATTGDGISSLDITRQQSAFWSDAHVGNEAFAQLKPHAEQNRGERGSRTVGQRSGPAIQKGTAGNNVRDYGHLGTACVFVDGCDKNLSKSWVTHKELVSLFHWLNERCGVSAYDRCLLSPSLGACEQLYDTCGMLMAGASVEIADLPRLKDTSRLVEHLMGPQITVWDLPTALMQNMFGDLVALLARSSSVKGPRNILLTGEKQSVSLADKLTECFPNARITGLYSNSALGIWTTVFRLSDGLAECHSVTIAEPIPGFEHQVFNKSGRLAPLHTKGELRVRRLFSAPELALQNLLTLKTGLRAQRLDCSHISWLRGEDHYFVKYGCCVELTKVEAALCQHQDILAVETITIEVDEEADKVPVAFIVARPGHVPAESVRDFLVLYGHVDLIPDRFIFVDEFPLTANGAIDRAALIRSFLTSYDRRDDGHRIGSDLIYKQLKRIWLDVLQVEAVGDDESFFAAGGNSLKATLLIARIRDAFAVDVSVQNFFRQPTVRAVAQLIAAESKTGKSWKKGPDFKAVSREQYRVQLSEDPRKGAIGSDT